VLGGQAVEVRLGVDDAVDDGDGGPGAERPFSAGCVREDGAEAEHVAGRADVSAFGLLR